MYKDSQGRERYLYLSLTDQMDVAGVPLEAFKIILFLNVAMYFLSGKSLLILPVFIFMMIGAAFVSRENKYNIEIVKRLIFYHSETYDA